MENPVSPKAHYRPFGFFRFFLAFLVLISHSLAIGSESWKGLLATYQLGIIGVMTFFILSGFVIAEAQMAFYTRRSGAFLLNRALRIFPPYFLALLLSIVIHYWLQFSQTAIRLFDYARLPETTFSLANIKANLLVLVFLYGKSFLNLNPDYLLVRYIWAIAVEIHFYLLCALAFKLFWYEGFQRSLANLVFPVFDVSSMTLSLLSFWFKNPLFNYFQWAPYFIFGVSLYFHLAGSPSKRNSVALWSSLIFVLTHASVHSFQESEKDGIVCFASLALLTMICRYLATATVSPRLSALDRLFGDLSYPLYLNHYVITILFFSLFPEGSPWDSC